MNYPYTLLATTLLCATLHAQTSTHPPAALPAAESALTSSTCPVQEGAIAKWQDRRFGMFIHWGPVSLKEKEIGWSRAGERRDVTRKLPVNIPMDIPAEEYDALYKKFNPVKFNADEWVSIAKAAGMKYMVFVAKHCDGFSMFDSQLTDYKITNSPFKRDVTAELAQACKKGGLSFGVYYCPPDWHHPDFFTANHARYIEYMHGQVKELLTKYGPIDVVWLDATGGVNTPETWDTPSLFKMIRQLQPQAMVTTRCGGLPRKGAWGDFDSPEQKIGGFQMNRPWESCMTVSKRNQWAWGGADDGVKTVEACLNMLIMAAGGDGNVLLNVGPRPDGVIDPAQAGLLKEMGDWLKVNGEAIYSTRGGPWKPSPLLVSTRKGNKIYLHLLKKAPVTVPALPVAIQSAKLLHGPSIKTETKNGMLSFKIPDNAWEAIDTIVEITIEGDSLAIEPLSATIESSPKISK